MEFSSIPETLKTIRSKKISIEELNKIFIKRIKDNKNLNAFIYFNEENIIEKVEGKTGPYLQKQWQELADHPLVGEARGIGMVGALELVQNKETREMFPEKTGAGTICRDFCFNNGLIMRADGDTMIISPPLIMSNNEIDELIDKARLSLDLTAKKLKSN